jgi:hypothetical protein
MPIKIADKPTQKTVRRRLTALEGHLGGHSFLKWDARKKEEEYEAQVFGWLQSTGKFLQQQTNQDIRASAFGFKHKPDAIYDEIIAVEIKKIVHTGDFHLALGQALCYRAHYKGVLLFLLDFTGKLVSGLQEQESQHIRDVLSSLDIRLAVKDSI